MDTGGPHLAEALDAVDGAVLALHLDASPVDVGDQRLELHLNAQALELLLRRLAQLGAERGEHLVGAVHKDDASGGGINGAEVALQGCGGQLTNLSGHLHARGASTHDDERHELPAFGLVRGELGHLEGVEDAGTQLQGIVDGLHTGGVLRELVVAEVRLTCAGGDDEGVVGRLLVLVVEAPLDHLLSQVDVVDEAEQHLHVLLVTQDLAGGRGDLALRQHTRCHLVQQRLEQVMGGAGDECDVDISVLEGPNPEPMMTTW